jgi:hypothetical protein
MRGISTFWMVIFEIVALLVIEYAVLQILTARVS